MEIQIVQLQSFKFFRRYNVDISKSFSTIQILREIKLSNYVGAQNVISRKIWVVENVGQFAKFRLSRELFFVFCFLADFTVRQENTLNFHTVQLVFWQFLTLRQTFIKSKELGTLA